MGLGEEFERLRQQKVTESQLKEYVGQLLPMEKDASPIQEKKVMIRLCAKIVAETDLYETDKKVQNLINWVC